MFAAGLALIFISERNFIFILPLVIVIGLTTWIAMANMTRNKESRRIYQIVTVGDSAVNQRQIAATDDKIFDITGQMGKLFDENKCRLVVIKWKQFSMGMMLMFDAERDFEVVCDE